MNYSVLTHLGGLPLTQERIDFLQQSYLSAFAAIAKLCGDKTILQGVETVGVNVTDGWISYNGELIPFLGGSIADDVVITTTPTPFTFGDASVHDVEFTKVATCGPVGAFPFADLVTLLSLRNVWLPGDLKEKIFVDGATADAYIAANFNAGIGINEQKGWAILTTIYPDTAGKVMVPVDSADANLNQVGKMFGAKTHTLTTGQLPTLPSTQGLVKEDGTETATVWDSSPGEFNIRTKQAWPGLGQSHNIMQPTYAILKLVKL